MRYIALICTVVFIFSIVLALNLQSLIIDKESTELSDITKKQLVDQNEKVHATEKEETQNIEEKLSGGQEEQIIISSKDIQNVDDSNVLNKFNHLNGFKSVTFDISSSKEFETQNVEKKDVSTVNDIKNLFKLGNIEVETKYEEIDTGFFNVDEKPVKQTYVIKNLLDKKRDITLNIRYEIDSDVVTWNNTGYSITSTPRHFKHFYTENSLIPLTNQSFLSGTVLWFENSYYDFSDIVNLDYDISVLSENNRNFISLKIVTELDNSDKFIIDPQIGWTDHLIITGFRIASVHAIDVNDDKNIDIIAGENWNITWYENDGSYPPLWTRHVILNGNGSASVYGIDLDKDNDTDVISGRWENIEWFENDGNENWTRHKLTTNLSTSTSFSVYPVDIDNDTNMDIVAAALSVDKIIWYENNGSMNFTERIIDSDIDIPYDIFAIDLDNDTDIDVLTPSSGGDDIIWYQNNGGSPPSWTERFVNWNGMNAPWCIYALRIDNDDDIDIVSVDNGASPGYNKIAWFDNDGGHPPSWTMRTVNSTIDGGRDCYGIDIDNDGDNDLLSATVIAGGGDYAWYENNGSSSPGWKFHTISGGGVSIFPSDLDNDGDLDVVDGLGGNFIEFYWQESNLTPMPISIIKINPVQVVENVNLVKDKHTFIQSTIKSNWNRSYTISVSVFFNNTYMNSTKLNLTALSEIKVNLTFVPDKEGKNLPVKIQVEANFSGTHNKTNMTILKNVIRTRDLKIGFIPVNYDSSKFDLLVSESTQFIEKVYPLRDNGVIVSKFPPMETHEFPPPFNLIPKKIQMLLQVRMNSLLSESGFTERSVGVLPSGWISQNLGGSDIGGFSLLPKDGGDVLGAAIIEDEALHAIFKHGPAHELGHTYGLCDEYNSARWKEQDTGYFGERGLCPNGDSNPNDDELDEGCNQTIGGCNTLTFGEVVPWRNLSGLHGFRNFMGDGRSPTSRWITNDSYIHLLKQFNHSSPENVSSRIIVSGMYNKSSGTAEFMNFYALDAGFAINRSEFVSGNFSIKVLNRTNNTLYNISFNLSFSIASINGNSEETNVTAFMFVIPFSQNTTKFVFKDNNITKDEVNRSTNTPNITLITTLENQSFKNEQFDVSWLSNDADGDNVNYAILFSSNNGSSYSTVTFDYNLSDITLNSLNFPNCNDCRIKILATDGMNTNSSLSKAFTINNTLNITELNIVYTNKRERIFRFIVDNPAFMIFENVSWILNTVESNISSQFNTTFQPYENTNSHVFYNYTAEGNYNVTLTVNGDTFSIIKSINMEVN